MFQSNFRNCSDQASKWQLNSQIEINKREGACLQTDSISNEANIIKYSHAIDFEKMMNDSSIQ